MPVEKGLTLIIEAIRGAWNGSAKDCFLFAALFFLASNIVSASTLSTNYADVQVENLQVGGTYNLTEQAQCPMWIGYNGQLETKVQISVEAPSLADLKKGYEPIPDISWVTVSKNEVVMLQDEGAVIDVTVSIPNDEKYLGRKFQAWIRVNSVPSASSGALAVSLALKGRIRFSVAAKPLSEAELKDLRKKAARAVQGVNIAPERFEIEISSDAHRVEVTDDMPLKCINSSSGKYVISFTSVDPVPNGVIVPREYVAGDPKECTVEKKKMVLGPDAIGNTKIFVTAMNKEAKKLLYVVKAEIHSDTMDVVKFVKVYVTQK